MYRRIARGNKEAKGRWNKDCLSQCADLASEARWKS